MPDRRIATKSGLVKEVKAWERSRNRDKSRINWLFTIERARQKLGKAYPLVAGQTAKLLDPCVAAKGVTPLADVMPSMVDESLASRPRRSARSYNHLQGTVRRLLDRMSIQGVASARTMPVVRIVARRPNSRFEVHAHALTAPPEGAEHPDAPAQAH